MMNHTCIKKRIYYFKIKSLFLTEYKKYKKIRIEKKYNIHIYFFFKHTSIFNSATSSRYIHSGKRFINCKGSKPAHTKYIGRFVVCMFRVFRQYCIANVIAALLSACQRMVLLPDWSSVPLSGHHPCQIQITFLSSNKNKAERELQISIWECYVNQ